MQTTNYRYTFEPYKGTYFCPSIGMTIERYLGVPEVVAMVHNRYFQALRFGDKSVEYFVLKTIDDVIKVTETHRKV